MSYHLNKRLFQGFIRLHILHHANIEPVYGSWLLEELSEHGHKLSPGTLYPILHNLEEMGLLKSQNENIKGKIRKYYLITEDGRQQLIEAKKYLAELVREIGLETEEDNV